MNYRTLTDAELAHFTRNVASTLASHRITGFDAALQDQLAAAIEPLNAEFEALTDLCVQITAAKESIVASKQGLRIAILSQLSAVHNYLFAIGNPRGDYELCNLTFRKRGTTVIPNDPDDLCAVWDLTRGIGLTFTGNNEYNKVVYEISRRTTTSGVTSPWGFVALTKKQSHEDKEFPAGYKHEYRIRAVAAKHVSNYSNTAMVSLFQAPHTFEIF